MMMMKMMMVRIKDKDSGVRYNSGLELQNTSSVGKMLGELEWPSLEAQRNWSSLLLFHMIHCGDVSVEKDKYLTYCVCRKRQVPDPCSQF